MAHQPGEWARAADSYAWSLPCAPHIPGKNAMPGADDDIHRIVRAAPDPTDPARWRSNEAWLAGLWFFEHGFFWEAHVVWDPVWMNSRPHTAERNLIYGLIHFALARLKWQMHRRQAAWRLVRMGRIYCMEAQRRAGKELMGLDLHALVASIDRFLERLNVGTVEPSPTIQ